ncbi:MAG: hypothetical protein PHD74_07250, partial [Candidatus Krumholzibacteria bacterium]|nr:hypothetical protein [Candidatus Krumholzibacteria bacterium]
TWSPVALGRSSPHSVAGMALGAPWALYRCTVRNGCGARVERYCAFPDPRTDTDSVFCDIRHELRAEGLYLKIRTDRALAWIPSVRGGQSWDSMGAVQTGPKDCVAFVPVERLVNGANIFSIRGMDYRGFPFECVRAFSIFTFETGAIDSFEAPGGVTIRLTAPSVRGTASLIVGEPAVPTGHSGELSPLTEPFALDFPPDVYARPLECDFDSDRTMGLYSWGERAGWRCIGVSAKPGTVIEIRGSGTYAVLEDSKAPVIGRLGFSRMGSQSGFFKSKLYYVSVREEGSGVDADASAAFLNGERVICEYDQYRSRFTIPIPRSHPAGPAKLRIEAYDRSGNRSFGEFSLVIE